MSADFAANSPGCGDPRRPNLFLIGAPKTGTTALATYLGEHPQIFFSNPKELYFWDADHTGTRITHQPKSLDEYLGVFSSADPRKHIVIAEGTTTTAQSRIAIQRISEFNSQARFVFMLRNPIDLVHSLHEHLFRRGYETEHDITVAWNLQSRRVLGECIPADCEMPHQLQYREVATFAPQIERLLAAVPESQRLIIVFDDFVRDTRACYVKILNFLNLADDRRAVFPRVNVARQPRFRRLRKLLRQPPALLAKPVGFVRDWYINSRGPFRSMLRTAGVREGKQSTLTPEFRARLADEFRADIELTSRLIGRDLTDWCRIAVPQSASLEALPR